MAISKKIAQLTALALKDRVLTYVERQTIVKAAMEEGITENEINEYLNKAIEERMKTYSAEELTHCPCCGAQVPLISDECFFCGAKLKTAEPNVEAINISGKEADIIRQENKRTAEEQRNIKTCPDCGNPFPLISNICPSCGHILHEQTDSDLNIRNLIGRMNTLIDEMNNIRMTTFRDVLSYRKEMIVFYIGALVFFLAAASLLEGNESVVGIAGVITIICLVYAFKGVKKMMPEDSPVAIEDKKFHELLGAYEMYTRHVESLYGNNKEAKDVLVKFENLISRVKKNKKENRTKLALLLLLIALLTTLAPLLRPSITENYSNNKVRYAEYYDLVNRTTTINAVNDKRFNSRIAPFVKANSTASLHIDIISKNWYLSDTVLSNLMLRIDNVEISSTGLANHDADTLMPIRLALLNKDYEPINGLPPILLSRYQYSNSKADIDTISQDYVELHNLDIFSKGEKDEIVSIMNNANGKCYANFNSRALINNIESVRYALDSAYYFYIMF